MSNAVICGSSWASGHLRKRDQNWTAQFNMRKQITTTVVLLIIYIYKGIMFKYYVMTRVKSMVMRVSLKKKYSVADYQYFRNSKTQQCYIFGHTQLLSIIGKAVCEAATPYVK